MNQKMCECEGTVGEAIRGSKERERNGEREMKNRFSPTFLLGCSLYPWSRCWIPEAGMFLSSQPCKICLRKPESWG